MERPLFLPLLSTIIGLTTADLFLYFVPDTSPYLFLVASFPPLFAKRRSLFFLFLSLFFFSWGNLSLKPYLMHQRVPNDIVHFASDQKLTIEGVVDSRPVAVGKGSRIYLRSERVYRGKSYAVVAGRILLFVGEGSAEFLTGDRIRFISRISEPRNYGIPGEFDYVRYLAYRGVYGTAYVASDKDVILIRRKADYPMQSMIDAIAGKIGRFIGVNASGEAGFILRALLLGDTGDISKETKDAYTKTGVNHILSISGFHVGIVSLFVFYILLLTVKSSEFLMLHLNARRLILLFSVPFIFFYLFLSGAAPATVRSVIMILAYVVAMLLEREVDPLNSLMLAAMIILACFPSALFDLSFQLSFLALWGIIVLTPKFIAPFEKIEGTIRYKLLVFLMVSTSATIATLMPVAYYFHRVTLTGLITNFFIVPLMGYGAVVVGFSALPLVFCCPAMAGLLVKAAAFLVKVSNLIIYRLAVLPTLPLLNPSRYDLLLFFIFLATITFVAQRKTRFILCSFTVVLFVAAKFVSSPGFGNEKGLRITFFSVGQGESTLVSFPNGKKMLIDGGGSLREGGMDTGEKLLAPALWRMGIDRLDYVVISHPHPDHMKGLKFILENFEIGEFWESEIFSCSEDYMDIKHVLAQRHIPVRLINAATQPIEIGKALVEPLSPFPCYFPSSLKTSEDANESSLVFRLKYGGFSMLFTGDIGSETENSLIRYPERLSCTVLKIPHHGSRNSSSNAFVTAASPQVALISAGYKNSFGLPSERTLTLLKRLGVKVFRTDLDGTIEVIKNKNGCKISTFYEQGHFN